jgi:ADP-ribose pyrophosphatase YjhB (NUDIX family)
MYLSYYTRSSRTRIPENIMGKDSSADEAEMQYSDYAVAVLVHSPQGVVLVRDPKFNRPLWKLPGGKSQPYELPNFAATRELLEETGVSVPPFQLSMAYREPRAKHTFVLYTATVESLAELKTEGDEGEEVGVFSQKQLEEMEDFLKPHRYALEAIGFLPRPTASAAS